MLIAADCATIRRRYALMPLRHTRHAPHTPRHVADALPFAFFFFFFR